MTNTEDLTRFVLRALGAVLMITGGLETLLGFTLGMVLIQPAFAHPTSMLGAEAASSAQLGLVSLGGLIAGAALIVASGPLTRRRAGQKR
jgi:hypothetical protein